MSCNFFLLHNKGMYFNLETTGFIIKRTSLLQHGYLQYPWKQVHSFGKSHLHSHHHEPATKMTISRQVD
jgi:hypothetical protein